GAQLLKQRLTLIMAGETPKRLGLFGRASIFALALALLPLVPALVHSERPADEPEGSAEARPAEEEKDKGHALSLDLAPQPVDFLSQTSEIHSLSLSPGGRLLASAGGLWDRPGEVRLWDLRRHRLVGSIHEPLGVASVAFSPDGQRL